ncbi:MAG: MucB/RseB C-terminal domain-containing protein [Gammaproteobacteria bacterium]
MNHRVLHFIFLLILLNSKFVTSNELYPDPNNLIDEMSSATIDLNYDGIFIYRHDNKMDTMRIIHKKNMNGDVSERLISLSDNEREIIRKKNTVKYLFPDKKIILVEEDSSKQLIPTHIPSQIKKITNFYRFEIAGNSRVAGLDAWIINIKPIDKYRYGYQLWIDKQSKLLLKSKLKNYQGMTLEDVMFVQMQVMSDINDSLLEPSISTEGFKQIYHVNDKVKIPSQKNDKKKWTTSWMPVGFSMSKYSKNPISTNSAPVEHYIYSDGLATISIFVEKIIHTNINNTSPKITSFGGVNTYSKQTDGHQITAVGEVPKTTVKLIANSVKASN